MRSVPRPRPAALVLRASLTALILLLAAPARAAAEPVSPVISGWPLRGAVRVVRGFDPPASPWGRCHRGVDLAARPGEVVLAAAAGHVTYAGPLAGRGVVVVDHGPLRTTYEPVSAQVQVGALVEQGQVIGRLARGTHCGATPCLHWGLLRGRSYLDPLALGLGGPPPAPVPVQLLPASARGLARDRAAAREAAERAVAQLARSQQAVASLSAPRGRHEFVRPVPGAVTSGFGRRFHPILKVWKLHDGTDFGAGCGTPIRAPYAGRVTRALMSRAYGHRLFIDHQTVAGHHVVTSYNHASRYVVTVGSRVRRGQVVGYVGATGYATGCHLHLMLWLDGRLTDPASWL